MGCFDENSKIMEYFLHPKNMGKMKNPDGVGHVGNVTCGDIMELYLKIKDERIVDVKFQTYGCAAAISSTSVLTELIKGKKIAEVVNFSHEKIMKELGEVPNHKYHCTVLAEEALKSALDDYKEKKNKAAA
ncbi:iron-sulfur cluster assembly scaffold protein [Patescibacteria group bacterium]|nr:iron-sulfur cluster assembly scaffold protein [Patescibacteria group bacterium]